MFYPIGLPCAYIYICDGWLYDSFTASLLYLDVCVIDDQPNACTTEDELMLCVLWHVYSMAFDMHICNLELDIWGVCLFRKSIGCKPAFVCVVFSSCMSFNPIICENSAPKTLKMNLANVWFWQQICKHEDCVPLMCSMYCDWDAPRFLWYHFLFIYICIELLFRFREKIIKAV